MRVFFVMYFVTLLLASSVFVVETLKLIPQDSVQIARGTIGAYQTGKDAYYQGDYATALRKFQPLAEQGDAEAQYYLGSLYYYGKGVEKNYVEAKKWYRKAAAQGHAGAQEKLGEMYEKGVDVPQDHIAAYMWFYLAAIQGDQQAHKNRERVAKKMADTQLAEAIRRAKEMMKAPDFTVQTLTGDRFNLYENLGKPIFLNFWATWCGPCVAEMPDMEKLHQALGDSILIVGIDLGESADTVQQFVQDRGFTYTFVLDPQREVGNAYEVSGIPVSVFLDANGLVVRQFVGQQDYETFLAAARQAIGN